MSVTIRLSRIGRKNQPAYKLVVSNTRDKRNGKYLDILGYYNPFETKEKFHYDKEKFEKWKNQGALVTDAVEKLIEGKYEFKKYEPKKEVAKEEKVEEAKEEGKAEEKEQEVKEEKEEKTEKEDKGDKPEEEK
jgi:small subunit ribosomal protein S16